MKTETKLGIFAAIMASPFYLYAYPALIAWMDTIGGDLGGRVFGLLALSVVAFAIIFAGGLIVLKIEE